MCRFHPWGTINIIVMTFGNTAWSEGWMLTQLWRTWCPPLPPRLGSINGGLIKLDPGNMEQRIPWCEGGGGFTEKKRRHGEAVE